jgi:hypothetical protein
MHPFFPLVERSGLVQRRVAALMGVSEAHFCKVKAGTVPATPKFRRFAAYALDLLNLRRSDGQPYTVSELFLRSAVDDLTIPDGIPSEVEDRVAVEVA